LQVLLNYKKLPVEFERLKLKYFWMRVSCF
jgi:hypothetical protein